MRREMLVILGILAAACCCVSDEGCEADANRCPDGNCPNEVRSPDQSPPRGTQTGVVLELPPELRTRNWGGGSCVHASTVNLLLWMGQDEMAKWWRNNYSGGEYDDRLVKRMEAAGLRYAFTQGDTAFFDWCQRTRRGAGIFYKPSHAINFVGMDEQYVYLLDNNATNYPEQHGTYERVPKQQFFKNWQGYGGFAWSLVYAPPPAVPVN